MPAYFAHRDITRRVLVAFLDFMASFTIEKYQWDAGTNTFVSRRFIRVPVQVASREEWLQIVKSAAARKSYNPATDSQLEVEWVLPRLSAQITGFMYDTQRKVSKTNRVPDMAYQANDKQNVYMSVPYNLDVDITAIARTMDDVLQITEQILPFFAPSMSIDVNVLSGQPAESIPVVLQSVTPDFPDEMTEEEIRLYQMTFTFQIRMNYYLPRRVDPFVKQVDVDFYDPVSEQRFQQYIQTAVNPNPIGDYPDRADTDQNPVTITTIP